MSDAWATLLTAVVPGALVLVGVMLTQRHQRRLAVEARDEDRVDAQRRLLAEVISTARARDRAFTEARDGHGRGDAWSQYHEMTEQFERLLTEALLFVGDAPVVRALEQVQLASPLYLPGQADAESVATEAFGRAELHEALARLQKVVAERFRRTVPDVRGSEGRPRS